MEFRRTNPSLYSTVILLFLSLFLRGLAQSCFSSPCLNGGTCQETPDGFSCHCPTQPLAFTGADCGVVYDACTVYECPKTHNCLTTQGYPQYQCTCKPELNCSINACETHPCSQPNSQCVDSADGFLCSCKDGYSGPNCDQVVTACPQNPCLNNGTCVAEAGNYTCVCKPGYTGEHCEVDINECASNPCRNEAICVDKVNKYICFCVPGFQGYHCEIDINECASKPCLNNGKCLNMMDHYECECATGYTGVNCETEIDECASSPCQNGALCRDHIGYFSCDCPAGYEGELCQYDIDECQSQPCLNGGVCLDAINRFQCNCSDTGFVGDTCEIDIPECASNPCLNNATCLEGIKKYSCLCWPGYSGDHCNVDVNECAEEPCENGALCLERSNQSYYGSELEFRREFSYSQAVGYVCRCQPGFTGENCSVDIDECASQPCQNGGTCTDLINGFSCHCVPGYTGVGCNIDIDECEMNPCENGASCMDGVADYFCVCPEPAEDEIIWGGKNCSVKLEGCVDHSCKNQAFCIPTYEDNVHSYICQCQHGFYGEDCSIPTTFSFTSSGYIMYDLQIINRTKRYAEGIKNQVSVRFRTTLPDMILVYRGNEDNYLILELHNGLLHALFRRNSYLTHLTFHDHRVDDGYWHKAEVLIDDYMQLIIHDESCSKALCSITQPISAEYDSQLPESLNKVYIGGLAQESLLNNSLSLQNFTGCLEDLEIDFRVQLPQNFKSDASFEVEIGCNKTDWCHPNPCHNEALCIDLWTNFRCDCLRPYEGPTCMYEHIPGTFFREGTPSYANFTVIENLGYNFSVSAFIRTLKLDGLLLQISNGTMNYFKAYLQNGWLHIASPSVPTLVFNKNIADGRKYMLDISVSEGLVTIKHLEVETQLGQLSPVSVEQGDVIYVGGLPPGLNTDQQVGYFKGCLQDVRLNNHRLEFFRLEMNNTDADGISYPGNIINVTRDCVSDNTCEPSPCRNEGLCTVTWNDFNCSCPANFTGRTCEEPVWCQRSPCPSESTCLDVSGGYVCLSNATFVEDAVVFSTNISTEQQLTSVSLDFRTRDRNAVLLQASKSVDSIVIKINDGRLLVTLQSGNSIEGVQFDGKIDVSDALWHRVVITMKDPSEVHSQWVIQLDNAINTTLQGSAGSLSFLKANASVVLAENYTGCLGKVDIGGIYLPFASHSFPQQFIKRSSGALVLGCRGADVCSENPCQHNGRCQDIFNAFSCVCPVGWEGLQCEVNIDDCKSNPCIHGTCEDLVANYQCKCFLGYTGRKCESDVDDCEHHQCQNGGSCLDGVNNYTCKCPSNYSGPYCQWPYPPEQCNKNVTCLNEGTCNSGVWGANCTCRPGFKGKRCEVNINDCESNPCLNGGTCQDSVNNFKCICISNYSGVRCEKDIAVSIFPFPLLGVAVPVLCGGALLLVIIIIFMVLTARKRRQSEGTYSPSQQEVAGARLEMDSVLKVPPEERLI
ncbi:protein crumbs homolog 2 [Spea bombifrons]|uniref:protein crumbs homolog 2 n=1 Tax=Spea bombifrons TaxID=233779 RepID=UPI0023494DBC|nr:protein crumbs homolog 2 [Spea bombifrons]